MIQLTIVDPKKDKSLVVEVANNTSLAQAASEAGLLKDHHLCALYDGQERDLGFVPAQDGTVELHTVRDDAGLAVMRHSTAHLMAQAVKSLFPDCQITIGPVIDDGFFYDIAREEPFTPEDLGTIETEMERLRKEKLPIVREETASAEAKKLFDAMGEAYKTEIIRDLGEETVSLYRQGDFVDLCRGPHIPHTGHIGAFKLLKVAGAYWRGDEKNAMLQRIYGTAWGDRKELKAYLHRLEEAKKRDHRKLGKELDLFFLHDLAPASPFFKPRGTIVYNRLVDYIRHLYTKYEYDEVVTPQIFDVELWKTSGHWSHYRDNMFLSQIDDRTFGVKPMNCPGHTLVYSSGLHSYRDLPIRMADFGRLHRYERSGVTQGLTRVRSFAQDDAHIFCTPDQIGGEIASVIAMIREVYGVFGFEDLSTFLSTRPEDFMGEQSIWDQAEDSLKKVLTESEMDFVINPGDGAFYGPKIDFIVSDAIGRKWQLATIQLDFQLPERFDLHYIDADNNKARPVMIHRAVLGSVERFFGILLEHFAGAFPFWLAPEQIRVLPLTDDQLPYALQLVKHWRLLGYRVHADKRSESLGQKIRGAQLAKTPVMAIVGAKEVENNGASFRFLNGKQQNGMTLEDADAWLADQTNPFAPEL